MATITPDNIEKETRQKMDNAVAAMKRDFAAVRTGKASPALVEGLTVDYYGTATRLRDIAGITAPEPRMLVIQPWDQNAIKNIEKAILASELGISPVNDGRVIRLPIPELSEERRKDLVKVVRNRTEAARVEVRSARREGNEYVKKFEKQSDITEDDRVLLCDEIQEMTDAHIKDIEELMAEKELELMQV